MTTQLPRRSRPGARSAAAALAIALLLAPAALTACGNKEGSGGEVVTLTAKDNETTKEVAVGEVIDIELEQKTGSTGYSWKVTKNGSPTLEELPSITEAPDGPPGSSGRFVARFKAAEVGQGLVELQYVGPGTDAAVAETLSYNIAVSETLATEGESGEKSGESHSGGEKSGESHSSGEKSGGSSSDTKAE